MLVVTAEMITELKEEKEKEKVISGSVGKWARCVSGQEFGLERTPRCSRSQSPILSRTFRDRHGMELKEVSAAPRCDEPPLSSNSSAQVTATETVPATAKTLDKAALWSLVAQHLVSMPPRHGLSVTVSPSMTSPSFVLPISRADMSARALRGATGPSNSRHISTSSSSFPAQSSRHRSLAF